MKVSTGYPVSTNVRNACRAVAEGHLMPVVCPKSVNEVRAALESPDLFTCYRFNDGTVLLVVRPPKPEIERIKDRLEGMTPGQHRIALKRIADVLSKVEAAATGNVAQVKAWLAEGFTVRHTAWSALEWIRLDGSGALLDEGGRVLDAESFFPEQSTAVGLWEIVP